MGPSLDPVVAEGIAVPSRIRDPAMVLNGNGERH